MDGTSSASTAPSAEVLSGLVERVTFHNAETGFCVLRVKVRGQRDLATVVGHAALVSAGEFVSASGVWVNDRTHGLQFPAVVPEGDGADHAGGHREVPRLRHDPRHRTRLRQEAGARLRRGGVRPDRAAAGPPARGHRHRPEAGRAHRRRLGGAEGDPRDHAVPALPRGRHLAGGAHLQDLRPGRGAGRFRKPLPARPRHPRHRLPHRGQDRRQARHRAHGHGPGPRRHLLRARRGHGGGALRPARGAAHGAHARAAGGAGGPRQNRPRAGTGSGRRGRRHARRSTLRLPRRPAPGRARDRRAAASLGRRRAALARHRRGQGDPLGGREDRPDPGGEPARGRAPGARVQGAGHHRRPGRGQDDAGQLRPDGSWRRKGRSSRSARPRAARPSACPRAPGGRRPPSTACSRPTRRRAGSSGASRTRSTATCWSWTRPPWWTCRSCARCCAPCPRARRCCWWATWTSCPRSGRGRCWRT